MCNRKMSNNTMARNKNARHVVAALVAMLGAGGSAHADLMLSGHSVTGAFGMPVSSQEKIWIQGTSVRRDFNDRGRSYTHLFDLAKKQVIVIDHFTRFAEAHDLAGLDESTEASAPADGLKMEFESTGNVKPLQGWKCREHELSASIPARLGNEQSVFNLRGKIWLASNVPEQSAIKALVAAAKKPGFFLAVPALAKMAPAQSRVLNETIRRLASRGLPCGGELEGSYEGNGPMVNLAKKLPSKMSIDFQQFSTEAIKPDMFVLPAGYRLVQRTLPVGAPK